MFEDMKKRAERLGQRRAEARVQALADKVRAELPRGIEAEAAPEGVRLVGRGLRRRFVLEAALRWMRL